MKIGYPCINYSVPCKANRTFRLASYSEDRLLVTIRNNLDCLASMLRFNAEQGILFFRISSDLIPFASHPVCTADWEAKYADQFATLGAMIQSNEMRVSMHPDQFVLINAIDQGIVRRSVAELDYHARVLDALGLDFTAKIQIHVGGIYGDRPASIGRFCSRFRELDPRVRRRLVIENDDRAYPLKDCLAIAEKTGIPVLFDCFHHEVNNHGEPLIDALSLSTRTWKDQDGLPMVDYSSQEPGKRKGSHAERLNRDHFEAFLAASRPIDIDLMLEIKEKEHAALSAITIASRDPRLKW